MITRRATRAALYDLRIAGVGVMLRPTEAGAALVARRMVELEETQANLDNIRARGMVLEHRCTVIAASHVRRRDGHLDTLTSGRAILALLRREAARGGPTPTRFAFADDGGEFSGSIQEFTPSRTRTFPVAAWDVAVTVYQPDVVA